MKATFVMKRVSILIFTAHLLLTLACRADAVVSVMERIDGAVSLKDGQLFVGEKSIPWKDVSYIIRENVQRTISAPSMLKLKSGELWACDISGYIGKKLSVSSPLFGAQRIDGALVARIDFVQNLDLKSQQTGTLYRDNAQPIPGDVLWIDREKIGLNTAVGSLILARDSAVRYVFSLEKKETADADEIRLRDGSVFKGKAE